MRRSLSHALMAAAASLLAMTAAGCGGGGAPSDVDPTTEPYLTPEGEEVTYEEAQQQMQDLEAQAGEEGGY